MPESGSSVQIRPRPSPRQRCATVLDARVQTTEVAMCVFSRCGVESGHTAWGDLAHPWRAMYGEGDEEAVCGRSCGCSWVPITSQLDRLAPPPATAVRDGHQLPLAPTALHCKQASMVITQRIASGGGEVEHADGSAKTRNNQRPHGLTICADGRMRGNRSVHSWNASSASISSAFPVVRYRLMRMLTSQLTLAHQLRQSRSRRISLASSLHLKYATPPTRFAPTWSSS